jgi:hypothetical protein
MCRATFLKGHVPVIVAVAILITGCANGPYIVDVSNDARFQAGYRPGEVWRLRADGYLVNSRDEGLELSAIGEPDAVRVPAGSTVRIERLGYLFNSEHPPVAGGPTEIVLAYGTLTDPNGEKRDVAVLPALHDGHQVEGTSLVVYPPDWTLLELAK